MKIIINIAHRLTLCLHVSSHLPSCDCTHSPRARDIPHNFNQMPNERVNNNDNDAQTAETISQIVPTGTAHIESQNEKLVSSSIWNNPRAPKTIPLPLRQ
jgi:hypothetical protein